jgi:hypothetical protein
MTIKTIRIAVLSILFGLTQIGFAQKEIPQKDPFTIRDRNGDPGFVIETLDSPTMFKHSKYFMGLLFRAFLKNVSGQTLLNVSIEGTVHKKDGTSERFDPECISLILIFLPCPPFFQKIPVMKWHTSLTELP